MAQFTTLKSLDYNVVMTFRFNDDDDDDDDDDNDNDDDVKPELSVGPISSTQPNQKTDPTQPNAK